MADGNATLIGEIAMHLAKFEQSLDTRPLSDEEKKRINQILLSQGVRPEKLSAHWEAYADFPAGWVRYMYLSND